MIRLLQAFLLNFIFILSFLNTNTLNAQCTGFSFNIEDITITSVTSNGVYYNYTIRNTGSTSVSTDNLIINNALSANPSGNGDIAAGGSFIFGAVTIAPNATYNGSFNTSITNSPSYPYLLMNLEYGVLGTCQSSIDKEFELIQVVNGLFSSASTEANSIIWNSETKCFTVQNSDHTIGGALQYQLFNASGSLLVSGNTNTEAATFINVQEGFYVLIISDGKKSYSKKIIY